MLVFCLILRRLSLRYAYDPFGVLMKNTALLDQPYMFSTKEYDAETGLSYYGYRYYNASIGKWTTRDPMGEAGGYNLYGFVGNNPVDYIDLLGLAPGDWWDPRTWIAKLFGDSKNGFITPEEGQHIADVAKTWKGTPFSKIGNKSTRKGADCSGSTWRIYQEAGFPMII
jgi:RHS repeat-associated protein